MLVLSRKVGERIIIGDNIVLEVTAVSGSRVRVGIQAPEDVGILRGELAFEQPLAESTARLSIAQ